MDSEPSIALLDVFGDFQFANIATNMRFTLINTFITTQSKIIEQLREEAKDALIHWAKTDKGYFMMKDALEKYFEATGANRSCGNGKETILLGRRIAAQRIVIDAIHLLNKYELHKIDSEMPTLIDGASFKSSISR